MLGQRNSPIRRVCVSCEEPFLQTSAGWAQKLCNDCRLKIEKPSRAAPAGPKVDPRKEIEPLSKDEVEDLRKHLRWGGYKTLAVGESRDFIKAFKLACEASLFMLAKFVLGMPDLTEELHRPVCDWLQSVQTHRRKLLMLPVVHLKTSIGSHAFPLWALIQPASHNRLFHSALGADTRILLHGETTPKAIENLSVIRQHCESNHLLRYLWRDVFYADPRRDAVAGGGVWTDDRITVRRRKILAEPSITAIGVGTALEQRHYDIIIVDDIACFEAAHSEIVMNRAKDRRKSLFSRLNDIARSIYVGIGTHWNSQDVYVEWKKDPTFAVIVRSAIENGVPIWPERHPLEELLHLQAEEGMGKVMFSANYMNNPLNAAFSALDWQEVRTYEIRNGFIEFEKDAPDVTLVDRMVAGRKFPSTYWTRRSEFSRGMPLDRLYPRNSPRDDETPEQAELRMLARLERKVSAASEGSNDWARLSEVFARQRKNFKERGLIQ
jgi:hypothetical protein